MTLFKLLSAAWKVHHTSYLGTKGATSATRDKKNDIESNKDQRDLLARRLAQHNREIVNVRADGNCFFHAMVAMLDMQGRTPLPTHGELRQRVVDWVLSNVWTNPEVDIMLASENAELSQWLYAMQQDTVYADQLAIYAMGEVLGLNIDVVQTEGPNTPAQATDPTPRLQRATVLLGNYTGTHFVATRIPTGKRPREGMPTGMTDSTKLRLMQSENNARYAM